MWKHFFFRFFLSFIHSLLAQKCNYLINN
jgi:hypothetical protein